MNHHRCLGLGRPLVSLFEQVESPKLARMANEGQSLNQLARQYS
jgi:hypothetical protein